jgi:hypothetical protein
MHDVTVKALAAIGADDPSSDWRLAPEAHAARLPAEAGALRRVLEQSSVQDTIAEFQIADTKAVVAQGRYKRAGRIRLYTGIAATIIGATFILPLDEWFGLVDHTIPAAVQYVCLTASFISATYLTGWQPFDVWMKARAAAEIARIRLFNQVLEAQESSPPGELPLLPLQLEYFRRYQLDVQQRYYEGRGQQHARAAGQTRRWQILSYGLSGLAAAIAMVAALKTVVDYWTSAPDWLRIIADAVLVHLPHGTNKAVLAIGVIASALFGGSISRSLMDLDERNASRYLTTAANLRFRSETELLKAREDAAAGAVDQVTSFVERIQAMISAEHQEWILLSETVKPSYKRGAPMQ